MEERVEWYRVVVLTEPGSIATWRRRRPLNLNDTPEWVPDPNFTRRTAIWLAPLADVAAGHRRSSKRARVTTISEAILGLPEVTDRCSLSGEECAICLNDFRAEDTLRAMPCAHAFHQNCIFQWLHRNAVCPLCRHQLLPTAPTTPEEEEGELEREDGGVEVEDEEEQEEERDDGAGVEEEEEEEMEWEDGGVVVEGS